MKKLFDIDKGKVVLNPTTLWIPEFKKLWDRDKKKNKDRAIAEISYIVFMYSFQSPYQAYSEKEREQKVREDFLTKFEKWEPDDAVKDAIVKFNDLQDSVSLRLLRSTKLALETIEEYFKTANPEDISTIVKNAKELGNLVQSLDKLERQVQKEQLEASSIRGQTEVGLFEL